MLSSTPHDLQALPESPSLSSIGLHVNWVFLEEELCKEELGQSFG